MSQPFQAPESEPATDSAEAMLRRALAVVLFGLSLVSAVCCVLSGVQSGLLAWFDAQSGGSEIPRIAVNTLVNSACCGGLSAVLYAVGMALFSPETHGSEAIAADQVRQIYAAEGLADRPQGDPGAYGVKTDAELVEVYRSIDRQRVPERFGELLAAVKQRVETPEDR